MELSQYEGGILAFGAIAFGLYLLIKGGDWTIDAATYVAEKAGLSPLFIGATIISFGTSVPELFTSINANLSGYPGISLGNVLGSNVANILMVLGITAMVFTIAGKGKDLMKDLVMMLVATAILVAGMLYGVFSTWMGLAMFGLLVVFVGYQYFTDTLELEEDDDDEEGTEIGSTMAAVGILIGGLIALALGSEILVNGAVVAGRTIGVPEAVIGLTVVAFGTSLPELSACIAAARKQSTGFILGNIIGSNTFNILSIVALTAIVKPLDNFDVLVGFDMWFMVGVSVAFAAWMFTVGRITFALGAAMTVSYVAFVVWQYHAVIAPAAGT